MSYLDFERGITSEQIRHMRQIENAAALRQDMMERWRESERILRILRSIGSTSDEIKGMDDWFCGIKAYGSPSNSEREPRLRTPNGWFASRFQEEDIAFGSAFFEEFATSLQGSELIRPTVINEDFFAAMLGGETRLGHKMVYLPADGFWFKDPKVDAFCPTSDKKVEVLLSNYIVRCAEVMGGNVDTMFLIKEHRRPSVLASIVNRAKTVLEANPSFFEGDNAPRRSSNGRVFLPSNASSPEDFIHKAFAPKADGIVSVSEAYQKFLGYCEMENLTRVEFREFKQVARELVL